MKNLYVVCAFLSIFFCFMAKAAANKSSDYTKTKYPIVLVHGMFGFDRLLGVIDYFYKVPQLLESNGSDVYIVRINGLDSTYRRGEELLEQIEQILAITGKSKVNLIGHSHGAVTSRYLAGIRPDLVASIISASGPHQGSQVADYVYDLLNGNSIFSYLGVELINGLANIMNQISKTQSDRYPDILASLKSMRTAETDSFNKNFPVGISKTCAKMKSLGLNGVNYFSFGGVTPRTNYSDPFDIFFIMASRLVYGNTANDGLVDKCSSHLGEVIRDDLKMNHLDTVNLFFGLVDDDPLPFYLNAVHTLKLRNL